MIQASLYNMPKHWDSFLSYCIIEGEEVYKVERILKHQKQGQGYQYYVAWKGYPISEASWEPEQVFSDDDYSSHDQTPSLDLWKHEYGTNMETGRLSEPSKTSLEILQMV